MLSQIRFRQRQNLKININFILIDHYKKMQALWFASFLFIFL
jgi:hypothetical protein